MVGPPLPTLDRCMVGRRSIGAPASKTCCSVAAGLRDDKGPELLKAITDFNQARDSYELHDRITADIHYLGPVWDMRKKYGSLSVLFDDATAIPGRVQLTDEEYRQLVTDPIVTGAIEAVAAANKSIVTNLRRMNEATIAILLELEQLQ